MTQLSKHVLWCEKYRPQHISEYIFHDESHRKPIINMIKDGTIPHLLFSGYQGTGKSTLSKLLLFELEVDPLDILFVNASDQNSVDDMRDILKSFISTFPIGKFKVVILDESDYLSINAQAILRHMLENEDNSVRFILTCNYEHKIINPLKSRLQHFRFKAPNIDDITELAATILVKETIDFDLDGLDSHIAVGYPDIRKIINLLQQHSVNGKLIIPSSKKTEGVDYKFILLDLIGTDRWEETRKLINENVVGEEWYDVFTFLHNNLEKSKKFSNRSNYEQGLLILAEHARHHEIVADKNLNASAMFIKLSLVGK
jgi:DNA polymerase III delta prime subunit